MKNALWLIVGIGTGFLAAHQVNRTEAGYSDVLAPGCV